MKRKVQTVEEMVMHAHYLEALEIESKVHTSLSAMERSDYEVQIRDLKETNVRLLEMIKTLQLTIDSLNVSNKRNEELVKNLLMQVSDLQKMIADLEDRNRRHNKNTYGKKSHKGKKSVDDKPSRDEEKDNYDGSHDHPSSNYPDENKESESLDVTKVKSEHLDKERGPRGPYTKMDAAKIVTLKRKDVAKRMLQTP